MRFVEVRYPLRGFQAWLWSVNAADTTEMGYMARVRALLGGIACPSDDLADVVRCATEDALREYTLRLSPAARVQTLTAWRAFATFAAGEEVALPLLRERQIRANIQNPASPSAAETSIQGYPIHLAAATWALVQGRLTGSVIFSSALLLGTCWKHVVFSSGLDPRQARAVEVRTGGRVFSYSVPMKPFVVLWDWARGSQPRPDPAQPLVASGPGEHSSISGDALHAILLAGRRGRLPVLQDDPPASPVVGAPPVPPSGPPPDAT